MRLCVVGLAIFLTTLLVPACDSDDLPASVDVVTGDTGGNGGGSGDTVPGPPDLGSIDLPPAHEPDTAPPRNPACGEFDDGVYGTMRPWRGFFYDDQPYTCNVCPGGIPAIQGTWRRYALSVDDPTAPPEDGVAQRFVIDGNTWRIEMRGDDLGEYLESEMGGWYFCSDQPENTARLKVFITEYVSPNGAFGWLRNMVWSADTLTGQENSGDMLLLRYEGVGGKAMGQRRYCKIGGTVWGKPCRDPFDN
jgi:hypothetical protein